MSTISKACRLCGEVLLETESNFHYRKDTERFDTACNRCLAARARVYANRRNAKNRDRENGKTRWYNQNLRALVIREYGAKCACCGESESMFLGLDHINNDGGEERRRIGKNNISTYRYVRDLGFPKDRYQLLCHNCNLAKGFYGECPHKGGTIREAVWPGRRVEEDHSQGRLCRRCKEFKGRDGFYGYKNGKLFSRCKVCCIQVNRERREARYKAQDIPQ